MGTDKAVSDASWGDIPFDDDIPTARETATHTDDVTRHTDNAPTHTAPTSTSPTSATQSHSTTIVKPTTYDDDDEIPGDDIPTREEKKASTQSPTLSSPSTIHVDIEGDIPDDDELDDIPAPEPHDSGHKETSHTPTVTSPESPTPASREPNNHTDETSTSVSSIATPSTTTKDAHDTPQPSPRTTDNSGAPPTLTRDDTASVEAPSSSHHDAHHDAHETPYNSDTSTPVPPAHEDTRALSPASPVDATEAPTTLNDPHNGGAAQDDGSNAPAPTCETFDNVAEEPAIDNDDRGDDIDEISASVQDVLDDEDDDGGDLFSEFDYDDEDDDSYIHEESAVIDPSTPSGARAILSIDDVLSHAVDTGASDVYFQVNEHVAYSILGDLTRQPQFGILQEPDITSFFSTLKSQHQATFSEDKELDVSYTLRTGPHYGNRFRLSVGNSMGERYLEFRVINKTIPSCESIGVEPELLSWIQRLNGLVMVNGPTGSGKSSTLASLLESERRTAKRVIISIEKPIEYVYPNGVESPGNGYVIQREVGADTRNFTNALNSALREDPDIILVGEVRDAKEMKAFIEAGATGHLALSTMHTKNVALTVSRLAEAFSEADKNQVLHDFADMASGICNQLLLRDPNHTKRFAIREILDVEENDSVRSLIADGNSRAVFDFQMEHGITMEHKLADAFRSEKCTYQEALSHTSRPALFRKLAASKDEH